MHSHESGTLPGWVTEAWVLSCWITVEETQDQFIRGRPRLAIFQSAASGTRSLEIHLLELQYLDDDQLWKRMGGERRLYVADCGLELVLGIPNEKLILMFYEGAESGGATFWFDGPTTIGV